MLRKVLTDLANTLREEGEIDESECFIDATFCSAKGGGEEIGPTRRGKLPQIGDSPTKRWTRSPAFRAKRSPILPPMECPITSKLDQHSASTTSKPSAAAVSMSKGAV